VWDSAEELNGIDYDREDPRVYDLYVQECAKHGAEVRMPRPARAAR
jgi:hypothetical protein